MTPRKTHEYEECKHAEAREGDEEDRPAFLSVHMFPGSVVVSLVNIETFEIMMQSSSQATQNAHYCVAPRQRRFRATKISAQFRITVLLPCIWAGAVLRLLAQFSSLPAAGHPSFERHVSKEAFRLFFRVARPASACKVWFHRSPERPYKSGLCMMLFLMSHSFEDKSISRGTPKTNSWVHLHSDLARRSQAHILPTDRIAIIDT